MFELRERAGCTGEKMEKAKEFDPMVGIDLPDREIDYQLSRIGLSETPFDEMSKDELIGLKRELKELKEKESLEDLIDGVNPMYDPDLHNEYSTNCGLCALATWMRANEIYPESQATGSNIGTISAMEDITGLRFKEVNLCDIGRSARIVGPNRNGLCAMTWPSGMSGHWVNLATGSSGELYVLDSQCGEVAKFEDYVRENPARDYYISDWRGK